MPPGGGGSRPPFGAAGGGGRGGMQPPGGLQPPGGMQPEGGAPGGGPPGGGQNPSGGLRDTDSKLSLTQSGKTLLATLDLSLTGPAYDKIVASMEMGMAQVKGQVEMRSGKPRMHELAATLKAYTDQNKHFPRGTAARELPAERNGIPWRPDQRVSWMAELLPLLGQGEYRGLSALVNPQKSWNDVENLAAVQTLVPHFLTRDAKETSWWGAYPGVPVPVAATQWVGVAGVGLDAAEYSFEDTSVRTKLGIFGYDRETKLDDVKDSKGNSKLGSTIALILVPATLKRPWLAGGGSTVMGVPETESIKPFVSTEYQGKKGTYAIMGDGKVRFIPETISDKDFQALCTITGDPVDVDKLAPLVGGGQTELKPQATGQAPPAPAPAPPKDDGQVLDKAKVGDYLKQLGLAYHGYLGANGGKAPAKADDLGPYVENDKKLLDALKSEDIVFIFGVRLVDMTAGSSNTVLAYEKDAPTKGGQVLYGDGSVKKLAADDFKKATLAKKK
jgi:hypothetical protein